MIMLLCQVENEYDTRRALSGKDGRHMPLDGLGEDEFVEFENLKKKLEYLIVALNEPDT